MNITKQCKYVYHRILKNQEQKQHPLHNPLSNISNNFERIFSLGKQLVTLNSNIGYNESPQELAITPGVFENILSNDQPIDRLERSEEHTSELQSRGHLVCRLLLEKKKKRKMT